MCQRREATTFRGGREGTLEVAILEGLDGATLLTHHVVVMVAAWPDRLEAGAALSELDPLGDSQLLQQLERPIDAREAEIRSVGSRGVMELGCGRGAPPLRQRSDDGCSRAPEPVALPGQGVARVVRPGR